MVDGLSHLTLVVTNLDRTEAFLQGIFDARKIYDSGDDTFSVSRERFFMIADVWVAVMEGDPLPCRTYNHIAFKISENEYDAYLAKVRSCGLVVRDDRARVGGEGRSIYFYDDDNHLFELHTGTLDERLLRYTRGKQVVSP